ncbi:MAG: translation initiation factor IF-3 [Candidatus Hydrogenedentes bacterium]|nr:translation initiation factor IF-3 [Candidatus Hydrogenedentota bacterium]
MGTFQIGKGLAPLPIFYCVAPGAGVRCRIQAQRNPGHVPEEVILIARPPIKREEDKVRINEQIRARQVRVVDDEGNQLGIMSSPDALREAVTRELDLVEVAPLAVPPVCRIMDYGKFRYEQKRRARESRKNQHTVTVKEIKFRPKIDKHDFEYKKQHVREFLEEGNKVKITVMFRGREMAHPEFGREILVKVVEETADLCTGEYNPAATRLEGRNMSIVLQPSKAAK